MTISYGYEWVRARRLRGRRTVLVNGRVVVRVPWPDWLSRRYAT